MPRLTVISLLLLAALGTAPWLAVRLSDARLDGEAAVAGLDAPVEIARDGLGVPTLTARSRRDLALATGFVHAQDRFFQMDLLRRVAAGELSALVGPAALGVDRAHRLHRFRAAATAIADTLPSSDRVLLEAYTQGVNAGLAALTVRPFEYLLLRATPEPWRIEDTLLVNYAMYLDLNDDDASRDASVATLHEALPAELVRFLLPEGTSWDAPLIGAAWQAPPIPDAGVCDLSTPLAAARARPRAASFDGFVEDTPMAGSNGWTVAASRSRSGRAIVANDMHLELTVPNIWYRMRWIVAPDGGEPALDVTGVTLPGAPVVVAGSNGRVAWGFTNSYGDWTDLVLLDGAPGDPLRYRSPDGWREIELHEELIEVRGGEPVRLTVRSTIWGPVLDTDARGRQRVVHWLAHETEAVNLRLVDLERAGDVDEAIRIAHTIGSPPQNVMLADRDGNIAWTIMGRIPVRAGYDPRLPASWADAGTGWIGWLDSADYPVVRNPAQGYLWTANARTADGDALEHIGRGGYDLGARAQQIRDRLATLGAATIDDMLALQLDDRALLEQRWRDLLLDVLARMTPDRTTPARAALRDVLSAWDGRARPQSAGYRLVREFRRQTRDTLLGEIALGCGTLEQPFELRRTYQTEGPAWRLVTERPAHLLPPGYADWDTLLLAMADRAIASCNGEVLAECRWGEINRVDIRHPLARAVPALARWLTVQSAPLPGGQYTPRVQQERHGASERFAVSPGDEAHGYYHMPGGQSGHPLSPYFDAGHEAWARGEPSPFLPGPAEHTLTLAPAGDG